MEAEHMGEMGMSRTRIIPTLPQNYTVDFFVGKRDTNRVYSNISWVILERYIRGVRCGDGGRSKHLPGTGDSEATRRPFRSLQGNAPGPYPKSIPCPLWRAHHTQQDPCATNFVHSTGQSPPTCHFSGGVPCVPGSRASRRLQAAQTTCKFAGRDQTF